MEIISTFDEWNIFFWISFTFRVLKIWIMVMTSKDKVNTWYSLSKSLVIYDPRMSQSNYQIASLFFTQFFDKFFGGFNLVCEI